MIEKVNPSHPDKVADRIAGAIVDSAYKIKKDPKIAVEVLLGHGNTTIIIETDTELKKEEIISIVNRIAGEQEIKLVIVPQDNILNSNQKEELKCGDNGIFKGVPLKKCDKDLSLIAKSIYKEYKCDGKYILTDKKLIICQSNAKSEDIIKLLEEDKNTKNIIKDKEIIINPLGYWTGGTNVDSGATNRKLGSDMAESVTGGGLHGKDLSKADVSLNIYAFKKAQEENREINLYCAIGDTIIDGKKYSEIVEEARQYINNIGGFEKFSEWGLY